MRGSILRVSIKEGHLRHVQAMRPPSEAFAGSDWSNRELRRRCAVSTRSGFRVGFFGELLLGNERPCVGQ
jgi:hypothetical protein